MTYEPVTLDHLLEHQTWALRIARQLVREEHEAEELVQKTWLAALRSPPSTARGARAWIRQVILNLARERHRKSGTRTRHERASRDSDETSPDASEAVSRAEIREVLADRLLALQEPYRSALTLRYYEDLNSNEIAERLGVPAGTVRWRIKVGLDQLREELDRRCHGERERWVSALFLLGPIGPLPRALERDALGEPAAGASGTLAVLGGVGLGSVLLGAALYLWLRPTAPEALPGPVGHASSGLELAAFERSTDASSRASNAPLPRDALAPIELGRDPTSAPEKGIRVRVLDAQGEPVADATLFVALRGALDERAHTDQRGEASVPFHAADIGALGLSPTRGRLALLACASGQVASALWHLAPPFERDTPVVLQLGGPDQVLRGRVLDERGQAVAGARLAWCNLVSRIEHFSAADFPGPSVLTTTSAADGSFTLTNIARGGETLFAFAEGFALAAQQPGQAPEVEVVLRAGAGLYGRILGADGRPAANVRVGTEPVHKASEWAAILPEYDPTRRGFPEATRTDADGRYSLHHVLPGLRTLWAGGEEGTGVASATLTLEDGLVARWDATLAEGRTLHLVLRDEERAPLAGWLAVLRRPGGTSTWWVRRLTSDEAGRVDVFDCPEGDLYLDVLDEHGLGSTYLSRKLVADGSELELTIATRQGATLSGILLDSSGRPELGGKLRLFSLRTALRLPLERDLAGRFEQHLSPGNYSLVLELEHGALRLGRFELAANENLDLGLLSLPAPGTLRIDGRGLANGTARQPSYSLFALFEENGKETFLAAGTGTIDGDALCSLLPGRYRVLLFDAAGNAPSEEIVTIESFAETHLTR